MNGFVCSEQSSFVFTFPCCLRKGLGYSKLQAIENWKCYFSTWTSIACRPRPSVAHSTDDSNSRISPRFLRLAVITLSLPSFFSINCLAARHKFTSEPGAEPALRLMEIERYKTRRQRRAVHVQQTNSRWAGIWWSGLPWNWPRTQPAFKSYRTEDQRRTSKLALLRSKLAQLAITLNLHPYQ